MRNGEFVSGPLADGSATAITLGGTAQTISAAKPRRYMLFQNISDTAMWLNFGAVATADTPSVYIAGGANAGIVFEGSFVPDGLVSVMCATTGKKFVFKEVEG